MPEPTLQFLGEQIARIQAELRELRGIRTDLAHFRAEAADGDDRLHRRIDGLEQLIAYRFDGIEGRFTAIDARLNSIDARSEHEGKALDSRIAQINETLTTHLQIMLSAIKDKS